MVPLVASTASDRGRNQAKAFDCFVILLALIRYIVEMKLLGRTAPPIYLETFVSERFCLAQRLDCCLLTLREGKDQVPDDKQSRILREVCQRLPDQSTDEGCNVAQRGAQADWHDNLHNGSYVESALVCMHHRENEVGCFKANIFCTEAC